MARFEVRHPHAPAVSAVYGYDQPPGVGFFVEVRNAGRLVVTRDGLDDEPADLQTVLKLLVQAGMFSVDDVVEATNLLAALDVNEIDDPWVRRAARALTQLRKAASE